MNLDTLDITTALRPGTLELATENADALNRRLAGAMTRLTREVRSLKGPVGLVLRKNFAQASTNWERFFWAMTARHCFGEKKPLEEALRLADEDLSGLSVVLSPL